MATADSPDRTRALTAAPPNALPCGHDLIAIAEWLPEKPPTKYAVEVSDGIEYETRYFRCRKCGQERNRPEEFVEPCTSDRLSSPVFDGAIRSWILGRDGRSLRT